MKIIMFSYFFDYIAKIFDSLAFLSIPITVINFCPQYEFSEFLSGISMPVLAPFVIKMAMFLEIEVSASDRSAALFAEA